MRLAATSVVSRCHSSNNRKRADAMDILEDFEAQMSAAQSDNGASASGSGGPDDEVERDIFVSPKKKVKSDAASSCDTLPCASTPPSSKKGLPVSVVCAGCGRDRDEGKDFLVSSDKVIWCFADKRGRWCQDCHTVWRNCFSGPSQSLTFFQGWLQVPANLRNFRKHLAAYLTLRFEGKQDRISAGAIRDRMDVLALHARLLGLPDYACVVMPYRDLSNGSLPKEVVDELQANNLVTIRMASGDRLGAFVPADMVHAGEFVYGRTR